MEEPQNESKGTNSRTPSAQPGRSGMNTGGNGKGPSRIGTFRRLWHLDSPSNWLSLSYVCEIDSSSMNQQTINRLNGNSIPNSSSVSKPIISYTSFSLLTSTVISSSRFSIPSAKFPTISRHTLRRCLQIFWTRLISVRNTSNSFGSIISALSFSISHNSYPCNKATRSSIFCVDSSIRFISFSNSSSLNDESNSFNSTSHSNPLFVPFRRIAISLWRLFTSPSKVVISSSIAFNSLSATVGNWLWSAKYTLLFPYSFSIILPLEFTYNQQIYSLANWARIRTTYGFFTSLCRFSKMVCGLKGLFCSLIYRRITSYPCFSVNSFFLGLSS